MRPHTAQKGGASAPSNIIPFPLQPKRPLTDSDRFQLALAAYECAKGLWEAFSAEISRVHILEGYEQASAMFDRSHQLCWYAHAAAVTLAQTPATNRYEAKQKKQAIGRIWLGAEGRHYDLMREGVAADEARFGKGRAA